MLLLGRSFHPNVHLVCSNLSVKPGAESRFLSSQLPMSMLEQLITVPFGVPLWVL